MENCAQCGKKGDTDAIRLCSGCKSVRYCSRDCQTRHWKRHKKDCRRPTTDSSPGHYESTDESAEAPGTVEEQTSAACAAAVKGDCHSLMTCNKCGLQRTEMNRCGRCHDTTYCSRDCQRADWKSHRVSCQALAQEPKNLSASLSSMTLIPELSWEEARSRAQLLYPGQQIVDKFRELEIGTVFLHSVNNVVGLVKIKCQYPNPYREGRCLEDSDGLVTHVLFHNEGDPSPYFRYSQLREGNFLCYEHAYLCIFPDGYTAFCITEAKEVRILEADTQGPKVTKKYSATTAAPQKGKSVSTAAVRLPLAANPSESWTEARSRAQAAFPDKRVVDNISDLDARDGLKTLHSEMGWTMLDPTRRLVPRLLTYKEGDACVVVVVQLLSPVFHPRHHNWAVKDRWGTNGYLTFHFEESPAPYFHFGDLRKGLFLCVEDPHMVVEECNFSFVQVVKASSVRLLRD